MSTVRHGIRTLLAVAVVAGSLSSLPTASADGSVVRTDSGPVRGTVAADHRTFLGVPFAAPPVGPLRWRSPRPPTPWLEPRDATNVSKACAQPDQPGFPASDEDCLYLNVTTPRSRGLKPVMVWLHGGGNTYGFGGEYDARRMVTGGDVVVVTVNYRLGVFGFLTHPALEGSGGFGLEDQQAALRWVWRNAVAFGGDPTRVTLFGESGGAFDVCAHLTSPSSRGLFHRAIMQSGACSTSWPVNGLTPGSPPGGAAESLSDARARYAAFITRWGCTDPAAMEACLRNLPASTLKSVDPGPIPLPWGTRVLPAEPSRALAEGRFHRMPVMSGTNRDEARLGFPFGPNPFTEEVYQRFAREAFGDKAGTVMARYPSSAHGSPALAWFAAITDHVWACPQLADDRSLALRTPTYGFEFADPRAPQLFPFPEGFPSGAYHASELAYLFDLTGFDPKFTPEQQRLADQMIRYWTRFAATGNPNGRDLPAWSRFRDANVQSLAPGAGGIKPVDLAAEHLCSFWSSTR